MGIPVLLTGNSGTGKSTSLRNFAEDEITIINVLGKPFPFKKKFKYVVETDSYKKIKQVFENPPTKSIIIDDAGYLITNRFMKGHSSQGAGNSIFDFYNKLADDFWSLIFNDIRKLPNDSIVYLVMHEDTDDFGNIKPKTIGKLLDDKVNIPGMCTVVIRSIFENSKYCFKTNTDGNDICKSPIGMFDDKLIENDLHIVDQKIRNFFFDAE